MSALTGSQRAKRKVEDFLLHSSTGACFLFTSPLCRKRRFPGYLFVQPQHELVCRRFSDITQFFKQVKDALSQGYYLAGYFTYEFGYAFESLGEPPRPIRKALAWLGIFESGQSVDPEVIQQLARKQKRQHGPDYWLTPCTASLEYDAYRKRIQWIKNYISAGDTYQVNFTFPLAARFTGNEGSLFLDLWQAQPVDYPALIRGGGRTILSLSPELFFRRDGQTLVAKPMKGTAARPDTHAADNLIREKLANSRKNRAENVMIVDLLRNDLGRMCQTGTVSVDKLFQVQAYRTVFQMTSTIRGRLMPDCTWQNIFRNIFPCGSVTGAPKIRTMQIISELEACNRGVYTGAVGYITPKQKAVFNVPIRTLEIDPTCHEVHMGIGSGIVADSSAYSEWKESHAKVRFATGLSREYQLIETMLWDAKQGYHDLDLHLRRLRKSALFFRISCDPEKIVLELDRLSKRFAAKAASQRIRLLLDHNGSFSLEFNPAENIKARHSLEVKLSKYSVDSRNIFLYHKTSNRELYNLECKKARQKGMLDVLFTNERGALTEGTITNIYLRKGNVWLTPPVRDGLLPGIEREKLLREKRLILRERTLFPNNLIYADEIRLSNSVLGFFAVKLVK